MIKIYLKIIISLFGLFILSSCFAKPISYSSSPIINNNIREIDLMEMGSNKYNLLIRGNVYSEQSDLRRQFTQEVKGVCGNNFEIIKIETSEVKHTGHKKPIVQGSFVCK